MRSPSRERLRPSVLQPDVVLTFSEPSLVTPRSLPKRSRYPSCSFGATRIQHRPKPIRYDCWSASRAVTSTRSRSPLERTLPCHCAQHFDGSMSSYPRAPSTASEPVGEAATVDLLRIVSTSAFVSGPPYSAHGYLHHTSTERRTGNDRFGNTRWRAWRPIGLISPARTACSRGGALFPMPGG